MADNPGSVEKRSDFDGSSQGSTAYWLAEIKAYEKSFADWHKKADAVVKRFRNEAPTVVEFPGLEASTGKFNILWSNVSTLQPAIYSRMPEPDITRTHKNRDPVTRASAMILEAATRDQIHAYGFDGAMRSARDDYLLVARGQAWVRYVPTYGKETRDKIFLQSATDGEDISYTMPDGAPFDGEALFEDGQPYTETGDPYRPVVAECSETEHIAWRDFGHTPAPKWAKVRAAWKREVMTRDQLNERFGEEIGAKVSLSKTVENITDEQANTFGDVFKRAEVYEIWDKTKGKVLWISSGHDEPLDEIDDPLGLEGFFPCPPPLYGTTTTDSLVPVTDYDEYRTQADEIDRLTERIRMLTKALRLAGAYDGSVRELGSILDGAENNLVPVDGWAMFAEKGGLKGAISFLPIKEVAEVIVALTSVRAQLKQDLYEITGLSDIVRGQSNPNETLGAQRIKGQFAGMRIQDRQEAMARFARDVVRINAEIIAEHFSAETLWEISGWEHSDEARAHDEAVSDWQRSQAGAATAQPGTPPQGEAVSAPPVAQAQERPPSAREVFDAAVQVLKSDKLRGYKINIETDAMVLADQQQEQKNRTDFIAAITQFLQQAVPAAMQLPDIAPVLMEIMMFGVRGFKTGRALEAVLEQASSDLANMKKNQAPPPPDPAMEKAKADIEIAKAKLQLEQQKMQFEQQQAMAQAEAERALALSQQQTEQARAAAEQAKIAGDSQIKAQSAQADAHVKAQQVLSDSAIKAQQAEADFDLKRAQMDIELRKLDLEERKLMLMEAKTNAEVEAINGKTMVETKPTKDLSSMMTAVSEMLKQMQAMNKDQAKAITDAVARVGAPKRVIRENGQIVGVE